MLPWALKKNAVIKNSGGIYELTQLVFSFETFADEKCLVTSLRSSLRIVVRVLLENDKTFEDGGKWEILIIGKLSTLVESKQYRCSVSLETSHLLWLSCLSGRVNSGTDADENWQWLELFVDGDQHTWVHCVCNVIEQVVRLAQDCFPRMKLRVQQNNNGSHGDRVHQEAIGMKRTA